jgi:uncharacterized membrane protein
MTGDTRRWIELCALAIEAMAVLVILVAVVFGTARFLLHLQRGIEDAYKQFKGHLARALLLGLEFLVAADIVRTVALEPTLGNVAILAVLVVVRTFLSWSLVVEIEGRWPWQSGERVRQETWDRR